MYGHYGRSPNIVCIINAKPLRDNSITSYIILKKKVFRRFYFVANQALLILSNGNRPLKVAKYLGDIFYGAKTLDFSKAPGTGNIASGVKSKDGEKVPFVVNMKLDGSVDHYRVAL